MIGLIFSILFDFCGSCASATIFLIRDIIKKAVLRPNNKSSKNQMAELQKVEKPKGRKLLKISKIEIKMDKKKLINFFFNFQNLNQ